MDDINLNFRYREDDYVAAMRLYYDRTLHARRDVVGGVSVLLGGVAYGWFIGWSWLPALLIIPAALLLLLIAYASGIQPRRQFRRDPKLNSDYSLHFSDAGIEFRTAEIDSTLQWSLYDRVWENDRVYLLLFGKRSFTTVPKRLLAESGVEAKFRQLVDRKITDRTQALTPGPDRS